MATSEELLKQIEEIQKQKAPESEMDWKQLLGKGLLSLAPALGGYAFGGAGAGAAAGQLGLAQAGKLDDVFEAEKNSKLKAFGEDKKNKVQNLLDVAKLSKEDEKIALEKQKNEISGKVAALDKSRKASEKSFSESAELSKMRLGLPLTKDTQILTSAHSKMASSYEIGSSEKGSPGADMSMVFNYMKLLDPASTVREGEQAQARDARGVPDSILNLYNSTIKGQKLTQAQRNDFMNNANGLLEKQLASQKVVDDQLAGIAKARGLDEGLVNIGFGGKKVPLKDLQEPSPSLSFLDKLTGKEANASEAPKKPDFNSWSIEDLKKYGQGK